MKALRFVILLVLAALCLPLTAEARRPRGTEVTGVILRVDHASRRIVFMQDDGTRREFVYAARAKFWHGGEDASLTALTSGMHVRVDLHQPLIGPNFVTDIRLLGQAVPANEGGNDGSRP